jgi:lipoprotein-releasing system permease protein
MISSFTIISVVGVMLGVLVLVVVMAVFSGLEREMKQRILGFTPHLLLRQQIVAEEGSSWQDLAALLSKRPEVESSSAHIADNVIIDVASWQRPAVFHAIDNHDTRQVEGIRAMLDLEHHPDSSADMGIDDRAVISSSLAEQYGIGVGTVVRLYSTRNFEQVMQAYKATEMPPLREACREPWQAATAVLAGLWQGAGSDSIAMERLVEAHKNLQTILGENLREPEKLLLEELLEAVASASRDDAAQVYRYDEAGRARIREKVEALGKTDVAQMDDDILRGLKSFVLPKEVEVIGVYQASQMALTPDLFLPLPVAQDLAGLDDDVHGVALRLKDPYEAEGLAAQLRPTYFPKWNIETWGDQYRPLFSLINQQRGMMYFALSFIVLVSAFSMMAVMFTVTIQKRREIGVMKALGAAPGQIVRVFLYQGMLLGAIGAVLGIGTGHLVVQFRGSIQAVFRSIGFDPFSSSLTGFTVLPAHHDPLEQLIIGLAAFLLCSLAALVPAFFAARSDAAKSLRNQ